jgi:hypothetical protein
MPTRSAPSSIRRLSVAIELRRRFRLDYQAMAVMIFATMPSFDSVIASVGHPGSDSQPMSQGSAECPENHHSFWGKTRRLTRPVTYFLA